MKKLFAIIFPLLLCSALFGQKRYIFYSTTDMTLTGLGLTSAATGFILGNQVKPLAIPAIAALDRSTVFPIDRQATYWNSRQAGQASDVFMYAGEAVPFLLMALPAARKEAGVLSLMYAETMLLNGGLTLLTKNLVLRTRPYGYNPGASLAAKQSRDTRKSFFSGHTSASAAGCFFAAKVWSDFHRESRWEPLVWGLAATLPAVTGFLRMRAGKHFFTDVATGYVVGAAIGWLVPTLHYNGRFQKTGLSIYGSAQGLGLVCTYSKISPKLPPTFAPYFH